MDNEVELHRYKTSFDISQLPVKLYALQITYKLYRYDKYNEKLLPDYKMFYVRSYEEFEKSLSENNTPLHKEFIKKAGQFLREDGE